MRKKVLTTSIFFLVLIISIVAWRNILGFKYGDGILGMRYLYKQNENSIDILVLGSSHAFEDVNTEVLFDEYGYASYVLAGSVQPFWNSYYYLKEALKTQTPKLVVLEGYAASLDFDYSDHSRIIKNNLGISNIENRIKSIKVSAPTDKIDDYIYSYRLWHSRYEELGASDFGSYYQKAKYKYFKGFGANFATAQQTEPDVSDFAGIRTINSKEEEYFRKIVELCKDNNIMVLVVISPYVLSQAEQEKFNYLETITNEYNIPFVNYNDSDKYQEMQLDFATDFADPAHLNHIGNVKYTKALGNKILELADIEDRRNDDDYESWKMNSRYILNQVTNHYINSTNSYEDFVKKYDENSDLTAYIYTISNSKEICKMTNLTLDFGVSEDTLEDGMLYKVTAGTIENLNKTRLCIDYGEDLYGEMLYIKHEINLSNYKVSSENEIVFNGKQYIDDAHGIYILIYDNFAREVVGVKQLRLLNDSNYEIVTK